jgi:hypothetical protein
VALVVGALVVACSEQEIPPAAVEPAGTAVAEPEWERIGGQGQMQFVVIPQAKESDRSIYDAAITELCKPRQWCGIQFWSDRATVPASLPMTDAAAKAQTASYIYNPNTGLTQFLWACRIHPEPDECFSSE